MFFALQQIYNPSAHKQFPAFPIKAKKELREKKTKQFLSLKNKKQKAQ